jgi:pSer/pThr/pTyr-binding forkhead associated (FHA) protein
MPFALQIMEGQRAGEILPMSSSSLTIGRSVGDLLLEDTEVSGKHCSVQMNAGELIVVDHASRNGTFLNGQRVERNRLRSGDSLRIGAVNFRVIEWPSQTEAADPMTLVKTWCKRISEEERSQFSQQISELIQKEAELCANDVQIKLTIESRDGRVVTHVVPVDELVLGRAGPVPLLAEDEEASRKHAKLKVTSGGDVQVEDLGSANGTFVNEERLTGQKKLNQGDIVRLGRTNIRVALSIAEFNSPIHL